MIKLQNRFRAVVSDPYWQAVFLTAFVMVFIKKWEPGGNLDTIWYSTIAKNIAESGDYLHFYISKNYMSSVYDHMPLMYWVTGTLMKVFGVSDLTARMYPMFCSFFSYILVFLIGTRVHTKEFGLAAVLTYLLCFGGSKWNGAVMHDVPLTTFCLGTYYCFLRAESKRHFFYGAGLFSFLALMTKGPIVGGVFLGIILWSLVFKKSWYLKDKHFYGSMLFFATLVLFMCLPPFQYEGQNVFQRFFLAKTSFLAPTHRSFFHYFAFVIEILRTNPIPALLAVVAIRDRRRNKNVFRGIEWLDLAGIIALSILIPLSFFEIKYPHYLIPFYPFFALWAAPTMWKLVQNRWPWSLSTTMKRLSLGVILIFVALPIKTTGGREKQLLNITNTIKLDREIGNKKVKFLGAYEDGFTIFQTFKFYGNIDLGAVKREDLQTLNFKNTYLVVFRNHLPLSVSQKDYNVESCVFLTTDFCVLSESKIQLYLPERKYPHEIY